MTTYEIVLLSVAVIGLLNIALALIKYISERPTRGEMNEAIKKSIEPLVDDLKYIRHRVDEFDEKKGKAMKLSNHFTIDELTVSQEAARNGISNAPNEDVIENLRKLCAKVLEPLRVALGSPVVVTSGYRSPEINKMIGGNPTSQHMTGQAADIIVPGLTSHELFHKINELELPFDQLIEEFGRWVHVSYSDNPRGQKLLARFENGKTMYFKA